MAQCNSQSHADRIRATLITRSLAVVQHLISARHNSVGMVDVGIDGPADSLLSRHCFLKFECQCAIPPGDRLYRADGGEIAFGASKPAVHLMDSIVTPVLREPSIQVSALVSALREELFTIRGYLLGQSATH